MALLKFLSICWILFCIIFIDVETILPHQLKATLLTDFLKMGGGAVTRGTKAQLGIQVGRQLCVSSLFSFQVSRLGEKENEALSLPSTVYCKTWIFCRPGFDSKTP